MVVSLNSMESAFFFAGLCDTLHRKEDMLVGAISLP